MVADAERKLERWCEEGKIDPRHAEAWQELFAAPMAEIRRVISADDERGRDLRQTSPLAGLDQRARAAEDPRRGWLVNKAAFDHLGAAATAVSGEDEIVVIGSQAILGSAADPPRSLLRSIEADLYPRRNPDRAEEIDGALGDGSPFPSDG